MEDGGYLLADGNTTPSYLYDAAFAAGLSVGGAVPASAKAPGSGNHYQSPHRLRSLAILRGGFGKALFRAADGDRAVVRQCDVVRGRAGSAAGRGWRGRERVRTRVWAKLLINAVRIRYG